MGVRDILNAQMHMLILLETLVQPLLVRRLVFAHESHFEPVAARLEQPAVLPRQMLGEHVKTIFIGLPISPDPDLDEDGNPVSYSRSPLPINTTYDLIRIVVQASHLRSFYMRNACRPSFFSLFCLLPSSSSIEDLTLTLNSLHMPGERLNSVPQSMNRLQNLRSLRLVCDEDWFTSSTPRLCLPKLKDFVWESYYEDEGASVLYLNRCDMRNLESLRIIMWADATVMPEGLVALRSFLDGLLQLRSLALGIPISQLDALLPLLPSHVVEMNFIYGHCNAHTVSVLPPSVHTLRVAATPGDVNDLVWGVLDHLATEQTYLQTICICIWTKFNTVVPFFWTRGLQAMKNPNDAISDLAIFTGRLLTHSSALSRKGIKIVDELGHTASMHLYIV
jgi:hypothetical protein